MEQRPPSARPAVTSGRPATARGQSNARPPSAAGRTPSMTTTMARPGSSFGNASTGRPPSSMAGNMTAARPSTAALRGGRQGTTFAAGSGRPGSRMGTSGGGAGGVPNVSHRPITQQGLQGVRPMSNRGLAGRQVTDKSYYMGLLRAKISEMNGELQRLGKETEHYNKERQNLLIYEKQAEDLAKIIKELQGQLADYNTLVDKLNTNSDLAEMQEDVVHLKAQNDVETSSVDQLFSERKKKEDEVKQLELELEKTKADTASLLSELDGGLREKFQNVKAENDSFLEDMRLKQQELNELTQKKDDLEDELAVNPLKKEAMILYQRLVEAESKRDSLLAELQAEGSPEEQRERLLDRVKKDNEEIASMDRQASEVRDRIEQAQEELHELDDEMENEQSEKNQKYRELRQKELQMDEFLESYDQTSSADSSRVEKFQKGVVHFLQKISKAIRQQHVVAGDIDLEGSKGATAVQEDPQLEFQRLQAELNRIDEVEHKAAEELVALKEKLEKMNLELQTYSNLDELKRSAEEKKSSLSYEKNVLNESQGECKDKASTLQNEVRGLKSDLEENEFYAQLRNLEQRLQHVEQNNFVLKEAVDSRQAETNFKPVAEAVMTLVTDYNQLLSQVIVKSGGMRY